MMNIKLLFFFFSILLIFSCRTVNDHLNEQVNQDKSAKYSLLSNFVMYSVEYNSLAVEDKDYYTNISEIFAKICHREPCPPPCPEGMNFVDDCIPRPWDHVGFYIHDDVVIEKVVHKINNIESSSIQVDRDELKGDFDYVNIIRKNDYKLASSVKVLVSNSMNNNSQWVTIK